MDLKTANHWHCHIRSHGTLLRALLLFCAPVLSASAVVSCRLSSQPGLTGGGRFSLTIALQLPRGQSPRLSERGYGIEAVLLAVKPKIKFSKLFLFKLRVTVV